MGLPDGVNIPTHQPGIFTLRRLLVGPLAKNQLDTADILER